MTPFPVCFHFCAYRNQFEELCFGILGSRAFFHSQQQWLECSIHNKKWYHEFNAPATIHDPHQGVHPRLVLATNKILYGGVSAQDKLKTIGDIAFWISGGTVQLAKRLPTCIYKKFAVV